jgi:hypothetical protein
LAERSPVSFASKIFCHVKASLKNQTFSSLERGFLGLARLSRGRAEAWQRHAAQPVPKTYAARAEKPRSSYLIISNCLSSQVSSTISINLLQMVVTMLITPW